MEPAGGAVAKPHFSRAAFHENFMRATLTDRTGAAWCEGVFSALQNQLSRPAVRTAVHNLGWLLAERAVRFVLVVVVGFFVARHLGPARLGSLSYCTAVVTLAGGVVALGLDELVKRALLRAPGEAGELLASSAVLRLGAAVLAYVGLLAAGFAHWLGPGEEPRLLAIVGLLLFQPAWLVPDLWLQAHLRAKYSVWAQTGALAAGAALRIFLIATDAPLAGFAAALAVEAALAGAGIHLLARGAGLRLSWAAARVATMRRLLAEAWPLISAGLAIVIYMKIDEVMLRLLAGPAAVGIYAAATRLTEIWYFVPVALATSLLPALLRAQAAGGAAYRGRMQQYYDVSAGAAYALSVPMALAAPWIVRAAYGEAFAAAGPIVAVHIWSSVFVFVGVARGQWLVNERLQIFYLVATLAGAAVNIALNFVLIPRWAGLGAAVATVVSQALAAWLSSFCLAATREAGRMQTRALLVPVLGWAHFRRG
jgi:PST family polysaccharide transporter